MRWLLDNNLSVQLVDLLSEAGHDVAHVRSYGMQSASDQEVLERARQEDRVLVSADTDSVESLPARARRHPRCCFYDSAQDGGRRVKLSSCLPTSKISLLNSRLGVSWSSTSAQFACGGCRSDDYLEVLPRLCSGRTMTTIE